MAVRIALEVGKTSSLRSQNTLEGYTHDWEVFVRGVNNADIQQYIEKVVFHLHSTFAKPKRVIKEPPYVVKETGYAGFAFPIDVYLKNKEEPKKFQINYDLQLQQCGPPVTTHIRHYEIFTNPSDDFRKKLLKGGATPVSSSEGSSDKGETKTPPMINKPKLSGAESRKRHIPESKDTDAFRELFGPPIKAVKASPENKKPSDKSNTKASSGKSEKTEKTKSKHSPHKDSKKEKSEEKKDSKKEKEREKGKNEKKRTASPAIKEPHPSPKPHCTESPVPAKKPQSSPLPSSQKSKELKKSEKSDKESKEKSKEIKEPKIGHEEKKEKKDKKKNKEEKEKKERNKDKEKEKIRESSKSVEKKLEKAKEKVQVEEKKEEKKPEPPKEPVKVEKIEKEKKEGKGDRDRSKHKHKKKDRKEKREGSKDHKEKKQKKEEKSAKEEKVSPQPETRVGSDSEHSLDEAPRVPVNNISPPSPPVKEKAEKRKKEHSRDESRRKKRRSKVEEIQRENSTSPRLIEPVSSSQSPVTSATVASTAAVTKIREGEEKQSIEELDVEQVVPDSTNSTLTEAESSGPPQPSPEDYKSQLESLRDKINSLEDADELQKVCEIIAETGMYELTDDTFDFDLCSLDPRVIQQIQAFFAS